MATESELTPQQQALLFQLVEVERSLPPEKQGGDFVTPASRGSGFLIKYAGEGINATEGGLRALEEFGFAVLRYEPVRMPGVNAGRHHGTLTAKAFRLYDEHNNKSGGSATPSDRSTPLVTVDDESLSPHDENILFKLIELDRSLPKDEQSRRFDITVLRSNKGKPPIAKTRAACSSQSLNLKADADTFSALERAGHVQGGQVAGAGATPGQEWSYEYLSPVELRPSAFEYYGEKHHFPTALAEERREFVDSVVSTEFPEVVSRLKKAYDDIWIEQPNDDWSGVAHECQGALVAFAEKIYRPAMAEMTSDEQPRHDQYEKKILLAIKSVAGGDSEIGKLLIALNDYQDSLRHDRGKPGQPPTTQSEAKRVVLFSYLVVAEVHGLLNPTAS